MPKQTRKYSSKNKTTTPEGYREYKKLQMREYRKRRTADLTACKERVKELEEKLRTAQVVVRAIIPDVNEAGEVWSLIPKPQEFNRASKHTHTFTQT